MARAQKGSIYTYNSLYWFTFPSAVLPIEKTMYVYLSEPTRIMLSSGNGVWRLSFHSEAVTALCFCFDMSHACTLQTEGVPTMGIFMPLVQDVLGSFYTVSNILDPLSLIWPAFAILTGCLYHAAEKCLFFCWSWRQCPSIDGHPGHFKFLAIKTRVAMNITEQMCLQ